VLAVAWSRRLSGDGVFVNVCHPGDVNSQLSNNLGFGGSQSPDDGARTPVWLATAPIGEQLSGKYFEHQKEIRCRFGEDLPAVEKLFDICLGY
jgi:hypothetical protein